MSRKKKKRIIQGKKKGENIENQIRFAFERRDRKGDQNSRNEATLLKVLLEALQCRSNAKL